MQSRVKSVSFPRSRSRGAETWPRELSGRGRTSSPHNGAVHLKPPSGPQAGESGIRTRPDSPGPGPGPSAPRERCSVSPRECDQRSQRTPPPLGLRSPEPLKEGAGNAHLMTEAKATNAPPLPLHNSSTPAADFRSSAANP